MKSNKNARNGCVKQRGIRVKKKTTEKQNPNYALPKKSLLDNRYKILDIQGETDFSITYNAYDTFRDKNVWVKEIFPQKLVTRNNNDSNDINCVRVYDEPFLEEVKEEFERKAKRMVQAYPIKNVANVIRCFQDNNTVYGILEPVKGITLKEIFHKRYLKTLSLERTIQIFEPVFESVKKLHSIGVKGNNIDLSCVIMDENHQVSLLNLPESMLKLPTGMELEKYDIYLLAKMVYEFVSGQEVEELLDQIGVSHSQKSLWDYKCDLMESQSDYIMDVLLKGMSHSVSSVEEFVQGLQLTHEYNQIESVPWYSMSRNYRRYKTKERFKKGYVFLGIAILLLFFTPKIVQGVNHIIISNFYQTFENASWYERIEMLDQLDDKQRRYYCNDYLTITPDSADEIKYYNVVIRKMVTREQANFLEVGGDYIQIDFRQNNKVFVVFQYADRVESFEVDLNETNQGYVMTQIKEENKGERISSTIIVTDEE